MVQKVTTYLLLDYRGSSLLPVPVYRLRELAAFMITIPSVEDQGKETIKFFSLSLFLGDNVLSCIQQRMEIFLGPPFVVGLFIKTPFTIFHISGQIEFSFHDLTISLYSS